MPSDTAHIPDPHQRPSWCVLSYNDSGEHDEEPTTDARTAHGALMGFYEGIGFLLRKGSIDVSYIDGLLRHSILVSGEIRTPAEGE